MIVLTRGAMLAAAFSIAALAVPAHAEQVVAPSAYATTDAPSGQFSIFGNLVNSPATFQFVVAASELAGIAVGTEISSIGFRFAGMPYFEQPGALSYDRYDIQIGQAANALSSLSSSFAANMGADAVLARSGTLTIPANTFVNGAGGGLSSFYDLGFTTPYTYAGGDLAVTIRMTPTSGNAGIPIDAFTPDERINTVFGFGSANATTGTVGDAFAPVTRFGFVIAAVPEPETWAMMIGGFGLVGGALRQRRRRTMAVA